MIYLLPNTAGQSLLLTLDEGRTYFTETFTDYLLVLTREENAITGERLAQVPVVVSDGARITRLTVTTVALPAGTYRYEVYGQNSAVNIDPENAAVVGLVERGWGKLRTPGSPDFYETTQQTITKDYVSNVGTEE